MDPKDQSNNPEASPIRDGEEFPPPPAPLTDSLVGALLGVGHVQPKMGTWQPPPPEELQGQFSQYEIRGVLGRGGMGAVYKGWQTSLQRLVAIKILPSDIEDDGMDYAERFKQEARAMAQFKHPGIVAVYDAGETRERLLYFVMECVEGKDVAQIVTERGRLQPAEALSITSHVCEAMAYAHERGVIHRDIKPSNVLIESDGRVKVSDFGLAKLSSAERSVNTANSLQIGSLDFMPPEALCGSENVDHRGDIYAVGGMLYQMLTGRAPHGRFAPPSVAVPGLDRRFDAIVDKAMHADAAQRYSSAKEMQAELERIAATLPAPAGGGPVNTAGPSRNPASKPLLATLLATAVVCLTSIAFAVWKKNHTQVPPGSSAPPDPNAGRTADIPNAKPASASRWHDAFAESPLREVIASAEHTAQGYRLPENNHWPISPQPMRSGALRIRATAIGEKFASLYVAHEDRQTERVRFLARTSEWLLASGGVGSTGETNLATKSGASPLDEMPHELLLARIGGRLRVLADGKSLLNEPDPSSAAGKFVLDVFPDAKISVEKVEYLDLDGVPEAEALKRIGLGSEDRQMPQNGAAANAPEPRTIRLWDSAEQLPKEQGIRWENSAVRLDARALRYTATPSRDAILRAEVRMNPEAVSAQAGLRYRPAEVGDSFYLVEVNAREGFAVLSYDRLGKRTKLSIWPLPRAYGPDEWLRLELHAIGDALTVVADGRALGTVRDTSLPEPGGAHFFATSGGCFRNISYVPLDRPGQSHPSPSQVTEPSTPNITTKDTPHQ